MPEFGDVESGTSQATPVGRAVGQFGKRVSEFVAPEGLKEQVIGGLRDPTKAGTEVVEAVLNPMREQWYKAGLAAMSGEQTGPSEAVLRGIAGSVPLVGPMAMDYAERLKRGGDVPEVVGDVAFDIATARLGSLAGPAGKAALAKVPKIAPAIGKGAAIVAEAASKPGVREAADLAFEFAPATVRVPVRAIGKGIKAYKAGKAIKSAITGAGEELATKAVPSVPAGASSTWAPGMPLTNVPIPEGDLAALLTRTPAFRTPIAAAETLEAAAPVVKRARKPRAPKVAPAAMPATERAAVGGELAQMLMETPAFNPAGPSMKAGLGAELAAMLGQTGAPPVVSKALRKPVTKPKPIVIPEGPRPLANLSRVPPQERLRWLAESSKGGQEVIYDMINKMEPVERAAAMQALGIDPIDMKLVLERAARQGPPAPYHLSPGG
jgi:hypothetical protein